MGMDMNDFARKAVLVAALVAAAAAAATLSGCAVFESIAKDFESDTSKLDRVVRLYDYKGDLLDEWSGEMRIESESSQSCSFIIDGKRYTVNGGIVVTEEV